MNCEVCGQPFQKGQDVYEVKLDNGKIILSHGYPCCGKVEIKRLPIKEGDWWIRRKETYVGAEMKHNDKWLRKQVEDYETGFAECEDELGEFKQKVLEWLDEREKELLRGVKLEE
jgi:hypothetical protein